MDWVCKIDLSDVSPAEILELQAVVKARFGDRARTRTVERWLWEAERSPVPAPRLTHVVVDSAGQLPRGRKIRGRRIA